MKKHTRSTGKLKVEYLDRGLFHDKIRVTNRWAVQLTFDAPEARRTFVEVQSKKRLPWLSKIPGLKNLSKDRKWLVLKPGFTYDGASGPTLDPPRWLEPPAVHDACYGLIMHRKWPMEMRAPTDLMFFQMLDERTPKPWKKPKSWYGWLAAPFTFSWWGIRRAGHEVRARIWYAGVDTFGGIFARPRDGK